MKKGRTSQEYNIRYDNGEPMRGVEERLKLAEEDSDESEDDTKCYSHLLPISPYCTLALSNPVAKNLTRSFFANVDAVFLSCLAIFSTTRSVYWEQPLIFCNETTQKRQERHDQQR